MGWFAEPTRRNWQEADYDDRVVATVVTGRQYVRDGQMKGWCPLTSIDDGESVFAFPFEEPPPKRDDDRLAVQFERWLLRYTDPPERAVVSLAPDGGKGYRARER